jgi:hypothetical protein
MYDVIRRRDCIEIILEGLRLRRGHGLASTCLSLETARKIRTHSARWFKVSAKSKVSHTLVIRWACGAPPEASSGPRRTNQISQRERARDRLSPHLRRCQWNNRSMSCCKGRVVMRAHILMLTISMVISVNCTYAWIPLWCYIIVAIY